MLKRFDTDGQPIVRDERRFTSKGQITKRYETPYGVADVARYVYQHSGGGATFCPLDHRAGIILSATPKFARMISAKYAEFGSSRVQEDMEVNHGRRFSRGYVANLAEAVAAIAESLKYQSIYRMPMLPSPTNMLVIAVDAIEIMAFRPKPAKVAIGSIGFCDERGRRQYTVYLADILEPENHTDAFNRDLGRFLTRLERELLRARKILVDGGPIVGISAGHPWSIEFLKGCTKIQFVDPDRIADLLSEAAAVYFDRDSSLEGLGEEPPSRAPQQGLKKKRWLEEVRLQLLSPNRLGSLTAELQGWVSKVGDDERGKKIAEVLEFLKREAAAGRMNYDDPLAAAVLANSGILRDFARVIFGDRIDYSRFKIGLSAARAILILRELTRTPDRWDEFWDRISGSDKDQRPRTT